MCASQRAFVCWDQRQANNLRLKLLLLLVCSCLLGRRSLWRLTLLQFVRRTLVNRKWHVCCRHLILLGHLAHIASALRPGSKLPLPLASSFIPLRQRSMAVSLPRTAPKQGLRLWPLQRPISQHGIVP